MFFERPVAAFRNLRKMLAPKGQLLMTTWRTVEDNPWLSVAKEVARSILPAPGSEAVSCGPGPFSLADEDTVRRILGAAGFAKLTWFAAIRKPAWAARSKRPSIFSSASVPLAKS